MKEIDNCVDLESLFKLWKKAQENESDEEYKKYKFGNTCKTSFSPEGIIDYSLYGTQTKLLFIAKEPNCGGNDTDTNVNMTDDDFWLRGIVNSGNNKKLFSNRIAMMANAFYTNNYSFCNKTDYDNLRYTAFMNLNKRGGYSNSNYQSIKNYSQKYAEYIAKEIEIIDPEIIICLSNTVYYIYNTYLKNFLKKEYKVIHIFHPSYHFIKDENYLKIFEHAITGQKYSFIQNSTSKATNILTRGIIINTNLKYKNMDFVDEMLNSPNTTICIFGNPISKKNFTDRINTGDYIFYYLNGKGIIAVGKALDIIREYPDINMKERQVKLIISPKMKNGEYIGYPVNSEFRKNTKNEPKTEKGKGFWLKNTLVRPYLYGDEVDKGLKYVKNYINKD